jgi:RHH-type rel operon transcriptional repressor/antitoxin RelB
MVYTHPTGDGAMTRQTAVRLSEETHERLRALAARTGRTATFYVREAVEAHLDDLEDLYLAERAIDRLNRGKGRTWSLDEAERELGLGD